MSRFDSHFRVLFDPQTRAGPGQTGDHQTVPGAQDLTHNKLLELKE
jgi:hypothetical protein